MGGERAARRITNSIRPGRLASLLEAGEAQTDAEASEARRAEGLCVKATAGSIRWVETGCSEGQTFKQRDPRGQDGVHRPFVWMRRTASRKSERS